MNATLNSQQSLLVYEFVIASHFLEDLLLELDRFQARSWFVLPLIAGGTLLGERIGDELGGSSQCVLRISVDASPPEQSDFEAWLRTVQLRFQTVCVRFRCEPI